MAVSSDSDAVVSLDKKRQELEANVNKLRNALQHWRKWEIDYGEFQEKLEDLSEEPSISSLKRIRDSIDATLITDKEVKELLGSDQGRQRNLEQITALLSRRIEYVQQNARSLQKQFDAAEDQLSRLDDEVGSAFDNEEGLPITEILEELDDDGNVVSGKTSTSKDAAIGAAGLLSSAGIREWVDPSNEESTVSASARQRAVPGGPTDENAQRGGVSDSKPAEQTSTKSTKRKKAVAFAPNIDVAPAPTQHASFPGPRSSSPPLSALPPTPIKSKPSVSWEVDEARKGRFHSGTRVIELNEDDEEIGSLPVVPPEDFEESEEDARLRREMTQYALDEVGAIVAEMDLEDDSDEDMDRDESDLTGSEPEDENEFGMTAFNRISDEDREQMLELEKKLQAKMIHNLGPRPETGLTNVDADDVRRLVVKTENRSTPSKGSGKSSKVHFAEQAEVLPTPTEPKSAVDNRPAFTDTVVERTGTRDGSKQAQMTPKKSSRFKSALAGNVRSVAELQRESQKGLPGQGVPSIPIHMQEHQRHTYERPAAPTGPEGQVLSGQILERPARSEPVLPPDETGMDPALMEQELAVENRRLFNKMVQQQGGFKPSPEDEDNPLMEEKDGKVTKVSRFKAARINAGGI